MDAYIIWIFVALFTLAVGICVGYSSARKKYRQDPVGALLIIEDPIDGSQMVLEIPDQDMFERVKRRSMITLSVVKRSTK